MSTQRQDDSATTPDSGSTVSNPQNQDPKDDSQLAEKLQKEEEQGGNHGEPNREKEGIPGPPEEQVATETHDANGELIPIEDRKSGRPDGKIELREEDAWESLGFSFSVRIEEKWKDRALQSGGEDV